MQTYLDMIVYRRPHASATEEAFIERFLTPLGVETDEAGNVIKRIGTAPVLWSCHTDTVHRMEGIQKVAIDKGQVVLAEDEKESNCLGADCTTGVWLMVEMIKAGVEGLYIFHRGEECGGKGSSHIATKTPELLDGIKFAIAFDRYGTNSVITHQFGRCASDEFANSLKDQLDGFKLDDGGIFTDTANYTGIVPECTNISVGYYGHHGMGERQNLAFMSWLLDKMIALDISKLVEKRKPGEDDYRSFGRTRTYGSYGYGNSNRYLGWGSAYDMYEEDYYTAQAATIFQRPAERIVSQGKQDMIDLVRDNPEAVADLLDQYGLTATDIEAFIYA